MLTTLRTRGIAILTLATISILGLLSLMATAGGFSGLADSSGGFATLSVDDLAVTVGANKTEDQSNLATNCAANNDNNAINEYGNLSCSIKNPDGTYTFLGFTCIICDAKLGAWFESNVAQNAVNPQQDDPKHTKFPCGNKTKGLCDNNGNCVQPGVDANDMVCANKVTAKIAQAPPAPVIVDP